MCLFLLHFELSHNSLVTTKHTFPSTIPRSPLPATNSLTALAIQTSNSVTSLNQGFIPSPTTKTRK